MSLTKDKGDLAEMMVAADLMQRGHKVAFPFGDNWRYDLIVCRSGTLERIQVKYTESDGKTLKIKCSSYTVSAGKQVATHKYTAADIDWIAVWDKTSGCCYYVPATLLGDGKDRLYFDLSGVRKKSRQASEFTEI